MTVSIIMASYNYASYIKGAIESVINQTYKDWELIIVDDASSDNSVEVVKQYLSDKRIKLFVNPENVGLAGTIREGLKHAAGDWIAFLECDDLFMPNSLEEKVKAVSTGADVIFTDLEMFQDKDKIRDLQRYFDDINKLFVKMDKSMFIENFCQIIPKINIIPTFSVVMVKKKFLESCDFNPICKASLDYYIWSQLANQKIYYVNKKLSRWRMHSDSYINKDKNNWIKRYLFAISIYYNTIKKKNPFLKPFLLFNYMRARLIYLKINRHTFKINIGNNSLIFEKQF